MEKIMANNPEDPFITALRDRGKAKLGDKLFEKTVLGAARACQQWGVSDSVLTEVAKRTGFEAIETVAVDQWCREASDGNKESAKDYDEWYRHSFPNSRKARWARGEE
jgi:hypothetical protein